MDKDLAKKVIHLCGKDKKMLLLNGRYYCHFVGSKLELEPDCNYVFFSESWKDLNCPMLVQYADIYVLDVDLEHGHHKSGYGKLYHNIHLDLDLSEDFFMFKLQDGACINVVSAELLDVPYSLKEILRLAGFSYDVIVKVDEPIESLDGVSIVDVGRFGSKSMTIEYGIDGKLYAETIDFKDVKDGEIVSIDSPRREVVINNVVVTNDNAAQLAAKLKNTIDKLKMEQTYDKAN